MYNVQINRNACRGHDLGLGAICRQSIKGAKSCCVGNQLHREWSVISRAKLEKEKKEKRRKRIKSTRRARLEGHDAREGCRVSSESRACVSILLGCSSLAGLYIIPDKLIKWQKLVI